MIKLYILHIYNEYINIQYIIHTSLPLHSISKRFTSRLNIIKYQKYMISNMLLGSENSRVNNKKPIIGTNPSLATISCQIEPQHVLFNYILKQTLARIILAKYF